MNGTVDVSSWLLMEDSADSEADSGFLSLYPSTAAIVGHNEDDAESCNYDTDDIYGLSEVGDGHEDDGHVDIFSVEQEEMNMGEVNVHELEDRLFWETCMAVGYP
ncbi:hypothetical protein G2W53_005651 [Senna tora]|uniref:Uncharacterized protein n=1 Tax=Senna tora TaxID=362788 RepID=A0A834X3F2_9FABA|nr:hypothetical protein G2W53_005651 [Senna tora]